LLTRQLAASERTRVRRSNLLDLVHAALSRCRAIVSDRWSEIAQLEAAAAQEGDDITAPGDGEATGPAPDKVELDERASPTSGRRFTRA